jgi:hypothetical protein
MDVSGAPQRPGFWQRYLHDFRTRRSAPLRVVFVFISQTIVPVICERVTTVTTQDWVLHMRGVTMLRLPG